MTKLRFTTYPFRNPNDSLVTGYVWVAAYTCKTRPKKVTSAMVKRIGRYPKKDARVIVRRLNKKKIVDRDWDSIDLIGQDYAGVLGMYEWLYKESEVVKPGTVTWCSDGWEIASLLLRKLCEITTKVDKIDAKHTAYAVYCILDDIKHGDYYYGFEDR